MDLREKYAARVPVIAAIRAVLARFAHYQAFPVKKIQDALAEALPAHTIRVGKSSYSDAKCIRVWGAGIGYDDGVDVDTSTSHPGDTWQERIEWDLKRADYSDYAERAADEEQFAPRLAEIEAQIEALQSEARALWDGLAPPKSATIRTAWDGPSYEMRKRFPLALKG